MDFGKCAKSAIADIPAYTGAHVPTVVFWDTCALLDIYNDCVNVPSGSHIQVVQNILAKTLTGEIINFSSDLLEVEFNDNIVAVKQAHRRKINEMVTNYNNLSAISERLNPHGAGTLSANDQEINIIGHLDVTIQQLIDNILFIDRTDYIALAAQRHIQKIPPGHNGFKDCVFWLQAIDARQKFTPTSPFYFITSNTKDYFINENIQPVIQSEAVQHGIVIKQKVLDLYRFI